MHFIDSLRLKIKAGRGGNGIISFRREAYVNRGGPDGGDGGKGGDIYFKGSSNLNTLFHLFIAREVVAEAGRDGYRRNQKGASGRDKIVEVPLGTIIFNEAGQVVCDITTTSPCLVARGGEGGKGNARFKSSRNPAPRISENGRKGEEYEARIELRFLSDVGLVGRPSAGKSSLLNAISNARSRVGDYDFTTLLPQLGVVRLATGEGYVVADLPGIIAGAASGRGLGLRFLQHVKRARLLVIVVDCGQEGDAVSDIREVCNELASYFNLPSYEPGYIVATKSDLPNFANNLRRVREAYKGAKIHTTSYLEREKFTGLKELLYNWLRESQPLEEGGEYPLELTYTYEEDVIVKRLLVDLFEVSGRRVQEIYDLIPLTTAENLQRFNHKLGEAGVWKRLEEEGVEPGSRVRIYSYEFTWSNEGD